MLDDIKSINLVRKGVDCKINNILTGDVDALDTSPRGTCRVDVVELDTLAKQPLSVGLMEIIGY